MLAVPSIAHAHFILVSPAANQQQDALGDPQKVPPCGDNGSAVPTGEVTVLQAGSTVTIAIDETVYHPGHYRVAIAQTPGELPAEPPVTEGTTDCGSVPIMDPAVMPVLADGLFLHDQAFGGVMQTIDVQLPADFTCENCTLQVMQWMAEHGAPCFYYHCAQVTIEGAGATETDPSAGDSSTSDDPTDPTDATASSEGGDSSTSDTNASASASATSSDDTSGGSAATLTTTAATTTAGTEDDEDSGCGCTSTRSSSAGWLAIAAVFLLRRRRWR